MTISPPNGLAYSAGRDDMSRFDRIALSVVYSCLGRQPGASSLCSSGIIPVIFQDAVLASVLGSIEPSLIIIIFKGGIYINVHQIG